MAEGSERILAIYPSGGEEKLGFRVVRSRLEELVLSPLGEEQLRAAIPSCDLEEVRGELGSVHEIQQILRFDDPLPLRHLLDVRPLLRRALPEDAYLEAEALAAVRMVLETSRLLHQYFHRRSDAFPQVAARAAAITPLASVEQAIARVVDEQGVLRDDASPELRRIRHGIARAQNELRSTLQRTLREAVSHGYATEEQPTVRGGRMVIPVRVEARRKMAGFVHDTSATGQTVYIEPAACLDLNNEVRELEAAERQEIVRILQEATRHLRSHIPDVQRTLEFLGWFDYAHARARLANEMQAVVPHLSDDGTIELVDAKSPSLLVHFQGDPSRAGREVVPLSVRLDESRRTLVITGPNAGGKSVAMKTIGLLSLMLGYGIPVPVDEKSTLCLFRRIYMDIGDEQSIEEDLSTFSSHVTHLNRMVREAGAGSLVLIDEAGTGTDPDEGAALSRAVLEALTEHNARTVATTHHGALKAFAHETPYVENGSMAFDEATLAPTYRFRAGIPGSSYAFPIARRQGLPEPVLSRAAELLGTQKTSFEELIATFEARTRDLQERLDELEQLRTSAEHDRNRYRNQLESLKAERDSVRAEALQEAERIVSEANARVEATIREIRESQAAREETRAARERLGQFSEEVRTHRQRVERRNRKRSSQRRPTEGGVAAPIRPGDRVVLDDGTTAAEVLSIDDGAATIAFGSTRLKTDLSRLTRVGGATARRRERRRETPAPSMDAMRSLQARTSIDVRGKRAHEAIAEVVRLIDDALAANLEQVEILHGKGTGALRQAIREELERHPAVASIEDAPWDQGGPGVSIVRMR